MKDKKVLNEKELEKVNGGANNDLEQQIEDALNDVHVTSPGTQKFKDLINNN